MIGLGVVAACAANATAGFGLTASGRAPFPAAITVVLGLAVAAALASMTLFGSDGPLLACASIVPGSCGRPGVNVPGVSFS
jgi:hypothetical protein